jgi:hypothetical protein
MAGSGFVQGWTYAAEAMDGWERLSEYGLMRAYV